MTYIVHTAHASDTHIPHTHSTLLMRTHTPHCPYAHTPPTLPICTHTPHTAHTHTPHTAHTHTHPTLPICTHTHPTLPISTHPPTPHCPYPHTHTPHTACVKDLIRSLRDDDSSCEIRRQLGKACILQRVASWITLALVLPARPFPFHRPNLFQYLPCADTESEGTERVWLARLALLGRHLLFAHCQFVAELGEYHVVSIVIQFFWLRYYRTCCRFSSPLLVTQCFEMMLLGTNCILSIL